MQMRTLCASIRQKVCRVTAGTCAEALMGWQAEPMLISLFVLAMHTQCNTCQRQHHTARFVSKSLLLGNDK